MSEHRPEPTGELDFLLQELARDPQAGMLRMASRLPQRARTDVTSTIAPGSPGLTVVERELLRCHREELAESLRIVARELVLRDEESACAVSAFNDNHQLHKRHGLQSLANKSLRLLRAGDAEPLRSMVTLVNALQPSGERIRARPEDYALMAVRLRPNEKTLNLYAQSLRVSRSYGAALRVARAMYRFSQNPTACAWAWSLKGQIEVARSEFNPAASSFLQAQARAPSHTLPLLNYLGVVLRQKNFSAFRQGSRRLESEFSAHKDEILQFAAAIRSQRRLRRLNSDPSHCVDALSRLDDCGELSMEVIRAFLP